METKLSSIKDFFERPISKEAEKKVFIQVTITELILELEETGLILNDKHMNHNIVKDTSG